MEHGLELALPWPTEHSTRVQRRHTWLSIARLVAPSRLAVFDPHRWKPLPGAADYVSIFEADMRVLRQHRRETITPLVDTNSLPSLGEAEDAIDFYHSEMGIDLDAEWVYRFGGSSYEWSGIRYQSLQRCASLNNYKNQLRTVEWQELRQRILLRDRFTCQRCRVVGRHRNSPILLNVHHKYYLDKTLPWQHPDECLQTLCRVCHEAVHREAAIPRTKPLPAQFALDGTPLAATCTTCGRGIYSRLRLPTSVRACASCNPENDLPF